MSINDQPSTRSSNPQKKPAAIPVQRMAMLGGQIAGLTLLIVLGAVFGGLWLDKTLGSGWILTILLVVLSAPISLTLTFWLAMRAVRDLNPPAAGGGNTGGATSQTKIQEEEGGNDW